MSEHFCFTVDSTAYLRNLDQEDIEADCVAVHYQQLPVRNEETGSTSMGLRFPTLLVAGHLKNPREIADRVATILNAHWDEKPDPRTLHLEAANAELVEALGSVMPVLDGLPMSGIEAGSRIAAARKTLSRIQKGGQAS